MVPSAEVIQSSLFLFSFTYGRLGFWKITYKQYKFLSTSLVTGKFGNIDEDREETHVSLVDCLRQRCRRKRRKEVRKVGVEITDQYVCTPHTPLVAAVLPRKRRRCSSKLCGPIGNEHESGNLCMEIQWRTFCHTRCK